MRDVLLYVRRATGTGPRAGIRNVKFGEEPVLPDEVRRPFGQRVISDGNANIDNNQDTE
jgi:hypothetical protein